MALQEGEIITKVSPDASEGGKSSDAKRRRRSSEKL